MVKDAGIKRQNSPIGVPSLIGSRLLWATHRRCTGVDWWLFGHELGHQWQTADWGLGSESRDIIEVAVNLFTMYTLNSYIYQGDNFNVSAERKTHPCATPLDEAELASRKWSASDDCEKLALYRQLIEEFGWVPIKQVFRSYYDAAYPRSAYRSALDGFAIRFSAIVQRDLVSFFRQWEYPLSETCRSNLQQLRAHGMVASGVG